MLKPRLYLLLLKRGIPRMLFFLFLGMYGIKVRWEYEVVLPNVEKLWIAYCNRVANIE